jgi:exopolyphosphatase/guanosine-5'-triphosphate,3'-diphosphate pyrophosphatase
MARFGCIDIGTNSVLLLVAERAGDGMFQAVTERMEITRLGRGVDRTRRLSPEGMEATLSALEAFAREARALGTAAIAVSATSAARDAENGTAFLAEARARAGVEVEILPGDVEAQLSFEAVSRDPSLCAPGESVIVLDIGGGSTELVYGAGRDVTFRHSFNVGAVRMTERFVRGDPPTAAELATLRSFLDETFAPLPAPAPGQRLVGVAGTVTTLYCVQHAISPYDGPRVHGGALPSVDLDALLARLASLPVAGRAALPGLDPRRADVVVAGACILEAVVRTLGVSSLTVSDRGLRWGLLAARFGPEPRP